MRGSSYRQCGSAASAVLAFFVVLTLLAACTSDPAASESSTWSNPLSDCPRGMVFVRNDPRGSSNLFLQCPMDPPTQLTHFSHTEDYHPSISPDGSKVAFVSRWLESGLSGDLEVWVLNLSTGTLTQLTNDEVEQYAPRWSPTGDAISFLSKDLGSVQLRQIAVASSVVRDLIHLPNATSAITWAPSGRAVAASAGGRLLRVDIEDGTIRTLFNPRGDVRVSEPDWSPSGERILVTLWASPAGTKQLWSWSLQAERAQRLSNPNASVTGGVWSPEGKLIGAQLIALDDISIQLLPPKGTGTIVRHLGSGYSVDW